eukprot:364573-Chlamydomonas_euryale.AAC.3
MVRQKALVQRKLRASCPRLLPGVGTDCLDPASRSFPCLRSHRVGTAAAGEEKGSAAGSA